MPQHPSDPALDTAASQSEDLHRLVWQLNRRMRAEVQRVTDVPLGQQAVLALLDLHPGMTSAELARAEFVTPQSMNTTVATLRTLGHVSTAASATDGRRQELHLTPSGRALLARIRSVRDGWLTTCLTTNLDARERETVRLATTLLHRATEAEQDRGGDESDQLN